MIITVDSDAAAAAADDDDDDDDDDEPFLLVIFSFVSLAVAVSKGFGLCGVGLRSVDLGVFIQVEFKTTEASIPSNTRSIW